ncbi:Sodium:solute symporter family protein [Goodfellowiella coeruleoviolacea]|uniref:Sodium:solute symporter family protein n=2 Tax=Goodfellowiella coeruleoviolacea TaxID=334858 RepID=A0AAE3GNE4_9PSEU|nr:cation acetate symporter [Goodfellowiella coeruleoviolacea]MCP2170454.1 Sodium:solute symporter family protein [Goodfellowiella coeruleoviolacea]
MWGVGALAFVAVLTFLLGFVGARKANTTPDFLVARRAVSTTRNAAAISGEYLSAASFLSVAGLILKDGVDALWYPIGFTAGYLALMLFVAAPLRRSGAYTLPDFAEARLGSTRLRHWCTFFVVCIGVLYLVPQLQSAGLTLTTATRLPTWVGTAVVSAVVVVNVLGGGMRAITLVQAFQYWAKLLAIAVPTFVLFAVFLGRPDAGEQAQASDRPPVLTEAKTITLPESVRLQVTEPITLTVHGVVRGEQVDARVYWAPGSYEVGAGTELDFTAGSTVPVVEGSPTRSVNWLTPQTGGFNELFQTYSLIFATFLGTMGLPHVLVRFYTNPDGRAARGTALHVLSLLGLFYLFPTVLGVLSRLFLPELLVTGKTDTAVLMLPEAMLPGMAGQILGAVVAAGAFAAFLSTSSGLLVSVAGVVSTDILRGRVREFRWATVLTGAVAVSLALVLPRSDASMTVAMSFALAASTFCPLLVLGIWWRGLTWVGAVSGMVTGGGLVMVAMVGSVLSSYRGSEPHALLQQPALVTVPVAFLVMVVVSKATSRLLPEDVSRVLLRMHAPDRLGFMRDRDVARFGTDEERARAASGGGRHRRLTLRPRSRTSEQQGDEK